MKIGIAAFGDVEATVERCRRLGVDRVYIDCPSLPGFQENGYPDPASLRAFKGRLEEQGIEAPAAHFWLAKWPSRPPLREGATNPDVLLRRDRRCLEAMLRTLELLEENGIPKVLLHIDLGRPTDAGEAEACWEGLVDFYRALIPAAEQCGVGSGTTASTGSSRTGCANGRWRRACAWKSTGPIRTKHGVARFWWGPGRS